MIPLSHSSMKAYQQCPHKYYRTKVVKDIKEDFSGEAAVWGRQVHKAFEDYFKHGKPLSPRFKQYQWYVDKLAKLEGARHVEEKYGMDANGDPCGYWDKENVMYRVIVDLLIVSPCGTRGFLTDHKTGKVRPDKQLHLNALAIFANFPDLEKLTAMFYWLPAKQPTVHEFHRDQVDSLWLEFDETISDIEHSFEEDFWPKKQTGLCPWCPVSDCEFYNPKRRR